MVSSSLQHCPEDWLFRVVSEGFSVVEAWRAPSVTMMVCWGDNDCMTAAPTHPFFCLLFLCLLACCAHVSTTFAKSSFHTETQIMQTAERVDMRGNRGGLYISSRDILIGLSKSLPPLPPRHLSSIICALVTAPQHQSLYEPADQYDRFLPHLGGGRRGTIAREGERGRWIEREQLRLCQVADVRKNFIVHFSDTWGATWHRSH